jgi:hypothetical protein
VVSIGRPEEAGCAGSSRLRYRRPPVGLSRADVGASYELPGLLAEHGFRYDSGLMDADHPYRLAVAPDADAATSSSSRRIEPR